MLDPRRPTSVPPSDSDGSILADLVLVGGTLAALYFAAYLYEIGFLWHLDLPISLAEIGFSRSLAIVAMAAPAGCFLAGALLRFRALAATGAPLMQGGSHAAITLGALAASVAALLFGFAQNDFLDSALLRYADVEFDLAKAAVFLGGITTLALFQRHAGTSFARAEPGRIALWSALVLLAFAVAVGLGWRGAELKESRPGSFLYLAGSDFALVRLYPDKAVFLRFDAKSGEFGSEYQVRHLDGAGTPQLARDLEMR